MITEQDIKQATMFIDGVDIYDVGALVKDFKIGATAVENTAYQGVDSTNFNVLSTVRGMRPITVTLFYKATTKRELALKKAKIDNALGNGKVELYMPDGFYYTSYLTGAGEESVLGVEGQDVIAVCTYTLQGIRHDALETIETATVTNFTCNSLVPYTDVRISFKYNFSYSAFTIACIPNGAQVSFTGISQNDTITIDGINKRILQNGAPCAGNMSFIKFPQLDRGLNYVKFTAPYSLSQPITVEYYPTY